MSFWSDFKPVLTYLGRTGRDFVCGASVYVTLKLQVRERMVLMNRQETRAGEIPRCLSSCEMDFVFNGGNETAKSKGFRYSFSL